MNLPTANKPSTRKAAAGLALWLAASAPAQQPLVAQLEAAQRAGKFWSEIEVLERLCAERPMETAAREKLARMLLGAGEGKWAQRVLERWKDPPAELAAAAAAQALPSSEIPQKAAILEDALKIMPGSALLASELARCWMEAGEPAQAVAALARFAPRSTDSQLLLLEAQARRASGDFRGALEVFRRLPEEDEARRRAAPQFERLERMLPEMEHASRTLAAQPDGLEPLISRGACLLEAGLPTRALQDARAALAAHPDSRAALLLALKAKDAGDFWHPDLENVNPAALPPPQALPRLAQLDLAVERAEAPARAERAEFLLSLHQPRLALADASQEDTPRGRLLALRALAALGRGREAAAEAAALERSQRQLAAQAWTLAAEGLLAAGDPARAEAAASRALRHDSRWTAAWQARAKARRQLGDGEGASEDERRAPPKP